MTAKDTRNVKTAVFARNLRIPFKFQVTPRKFMIETSARFLGKRGEEVCK
jgi:hypothetical protein